MEWVRADRVKQRAIANTIKDQARGWNGLEGNGPRRAVVGVVSCNGKGGCWCGEGTSGNGEIGG